MKFILILTLYISSSRATVDTAEFNTKEACVAAGIAWAKQNTSPIRNAVYVCAAKGY